MGATNRPAAIDAALLRPGRFDAVLYVPPPDDVGRAEALRVHTRGMALAPDVDLAATAVATPLFTGAGKSLGVAVDGTDRSRGFISTRL